MLKKEVPRGRDPQASFLCVIVTYPTWCGMCLLISQFGNKIEHWELSGGSGRLTAVKEVSKKAAEGKEPRRKPGTAVPRHGRVFHEVAKDQVHRAGKGWCFPRGVPQKTKAAIQAADETKRPAVREVKQCTT